MKERLLIINATPLGTYPKTETFPAIPYEYITEKTFAIRPGIQSGSNAIYGKREGKRSSCKKRVRHATWASFKGL